MGVALDESIERYLRACDRRRRGAAVLAAAGRATALAAAWVVAGCLLDRVFHLPAFLRIAVLIAGATSVVGVVIGALSRVFGAAPEWAKLAAEVEARRPAFRQRLRTVVSQALEPERHRGSSGMLDALTAEVVREVAGSPKVAWRDWGRGVRGWWVALTLLMALAFMWRVPWLEMPTLVARLVDPSAEIAPVTTTKLVAAPGDVRVSPGESLAVRAEVRDHEGAAVDLFTSHDGTSWTRVLMLPAAEGQYVFTVPSLDRDLRYYVSAGDARTRVFRATVVRAPAVAGYRVRYEYPPYAGVAPREETRPDGVVEAVAGTRVTLSVTATEPLRSASLSFGENRLVGIRTSESNVARFTFTLEAGPEEAATIDLLSDRAVASASPAVVAVRALDDEPPRVSLLAPKNDLRLRADDVLPVRQTSDDDFSVTRVEAEVVVRGRRVLTQAGPGWELDPSTLAAGVGDVVSLTFVASDALGQSARSETRHVLISPRSVKEEDYERAEELLRASAFAGNAVRELQGTYDALSSVQRVRVDSEAERLTRRMRAGSALAGAVEQVATLRRSLLRAAARGAEGTLGEAIANLADQARRQMAVGERLSALDAAGADPGVLMQEAQSMQAACRVLAGAVRTVADGELAGLLLTERENLAVASSVRVADDAARRLRDDVVAQARARVADYLRTAGIRPGSDAEVDSRLKGRREAGAKLVRAMQPVEFESAGSEWVLATMGTARAAPPLAERLATASMVEALRADGDPLRAYDLRLAHAAVTRLQNGLATNRSDSAMRMLADLPRLLNSLDGEHGVRRSLGENGLTWQPTPPGADAHIEEARTRLGEWAVPSPPTTQGVPPPTSMPAEEGDELLALRAAFATVHGDFDAAAAADLKLIREAQRRSVPVDVRWFNDARQAAIATHRASARQRELLRRTRDGERLAGDAEEVASVGEQQRQLAAELEALAKGASPSSTTSSRVFVVPALARRNLGKARENAAAAVESLTAGTPDVVAAAARQEAVAGALDDAWSEVARVLHRERLRLVPTFRALTDDVGVELPHTTADGTEAAAARSTRPTSSTGPSTTRRTTTTNPRTAPTTRPAATGYDESLKLYFDAIRRAQAGAGR